MRRDGRGRRPCAEIRNAPPSTAPQTTSTPPPPSARPITRFTFGDVTPTFTGHEIWSGSAWLHSVNRPDIGESCHPTAAGRSGGYLPVLSAKA